MTKKSKPIYIAIDFDGTIVEHHYPEIGPQCPGAFEWMKKFIEAGAKLILFTMRSGDTLIEAVDFCSTAGIRFFGVNENPSQFTWTNSPKPYAQVYIDDHGIGVPLRDSFTVERKSVDWHNVGPMVMNEIEARQ
jgi:hypothetical protein